MGVGGLKVKNPAKVHVEKKNIDWISQRIRYVHYVNKYVNNATFLQKARISVILNRTIVSANFQRSLDQMMKPYVIQKSFDCLGKI